MNFVPFTITESVCGGKGFVHVPVNYKLESRSIVSLNRTKGGNDQARVEGFRVLQELDWEVLLCLDVPCE